MKINRINRLIAKIYTFFVKKKFYQVGHKSIIFFPLSIDNPASISIKKNCFIGEGAWLMGNQKKGCKTLVIQDGTIIGHYSHVVALKKVIIKEKVLIADKVFISDTEHEFTDISKPIVDQDVKTGKGVVIGAGSWIGENVSVLNAKIGKHCIIGANSVVTKDIPDYSVAVGIPAKVIKKYDHNKNAWIKVKK